VHTLVDIGPTWDIGPILGPYWCNIVVLPGDRVLVE